MEKNIWNHSFIILRQKQKAVILSTNAYSFFFFFYIHLHLQHLIYAIIQSDLLECFIASVQKHILTLVQKVRILEYLNVTMLLES